MFISWFEINFLMFFEKDKEQIFIKFGDVKELYADSFFSFYNKENLWYILIHKGIKVFINFSKEMIFYSSEIIIFDIKI